MMVKMTINLASYNVAIAAMQDVYESKLKKLSKASAVDPKFRILYDECTNLAACITDFEDSKILVS